MSLEDEIKRCKALISSATRRSHTALVLPTLWYILFLTTYVDVFQVPHSSLLATTNVYFNVLFIAGRGFFGGTLLTQKLTWNNDDPSSACVTSPAFANGEQSGSELARPLQRAGRRQGFAEQTGWSTTQVRAGKSTRQPSHLRNGTNASQQPELASKRWSAFAVFKVPKVICSKTLSKICSVKQCM